MSTPGRLALAGLALAAVLGACFSEHSEPATDNSALCSSPPGSLVNGSTLVTMLPRHWYESRKLGRPFHRPATSWVNSRSG